MGRVTKVTLIAPRQSARKDPQPPKHLKIMPATRAFVAPASPSSSRAPAIAEELSLPDAPTVSAPTTPIAPPSEVVPLPAMTGGVTTVLPAKVQPSTDAVHTGIFAAKKTSAQSPASPRGIRTGSLAGVSSEGTVTKRALSVADSGLGTAAFASPQRTGGSFSTARTGAITIDFKPKPEYTDEARQRRIEGEVIVRVRFKASGDAEALEVVQTLGYGLDEAALSAVKDIRFHPGLQDGAPVDQIAAVHFLFRLAY